MATTKKRPTASAKSKAAGKKPTSGFLPVSATPAVQIQVVIILILAVLFLLFAVSRYS
jgi:hypothetical protein